MPDEEEQLKKLMEAKLDEIAERIRTAASDNLVKNGSVDTGQLLGSSFVTKRPGERIVGWDAPHASVIEWGAPPHPVPVKPLQKWAIRKLQLTEKESWSAAYAIANKIKKFGAEPKPFLRPAIKKVMSTAGAGVSAFL